MSKSKKKGQGVPATRPSKIEILPPGGVSEKAKLLAEFAEFASKMNLDIDDDDDDFDDLDDLDDYLDNMPPQIDVMQLPHGKGLPLPEYQTDCASGMDLAAAVPEAAPVTIAPGARALIPTGLAMGIPIGLEGQVRPRSGLALKHGVTVLNAPGTIDADYRGEVGVLLINHGTEPFTIARGDRIAQLVFAPVSHVDLIEDDDLAETWRADGGFSSTG